MTATAKKIDAADLNAEGKLPDSPFAACESKSDAEPLFVGVADFFEQCDEKVVYLLEPYIVRGAFTLVASAPKAGKTFFCGWLAAEVAAKVGPVLFVEEEGPKEIMRDRLAPFVGTNPRALQEKLRIAHRKRFRLDDEQWVDSLIAEAKAAGAILIVLDPCIQLHGRNENVASGDDGMAVVTQAIERIIAETGAAVVVVHHTKKSPRSWDKSISGDEEAQSSDIRGTGGLVSAADLIVQLKAVPHADRRPGEVRFYVEDSDSRLAPFAKRLAVVNLAGGPGAMTFVIPESRDTAELNRLLPFIPYEPEVITVDELRNVAGGAAGKVRSAIKLGVGDQIISRRSGKDGGVYRVRNDRLVGDSR